MFSNGLKKAKKKNVKIQLFFAFVFDEHQKCFSTNLNVFNGPQSSAESIAKIRIEVVQTSQMLKQEKIHLNRLKLLLLLLLLKFLRIFRNNFHVVVANFCSKILDRTLKEMSIIVFRGQLIESIISSRGDTNELEDQILSFFLFVISMRIVVTLTKRSKTVESNFERLFLLLDFVTFLFLPIGNVVKNVSVKRD